MKVNLRHVQQRKQAYFFRMAIPEGLRPFYDGRKEISQSLRTDNPIELQQMAQQLAAFYRQQFRELRAGRLQQGQELCVDSLITRELKYQEELPMQPKAELAPPKPKDHEHIFSVVYDEVKNLGKRNRKSETERKQTIQLLVEWLGDLPIEDYTRPMILDFRDNVIRRIPLQMAHRKDCKGKSLKQILRKKHTKTLSNCAINNRLTQVQGVFGHAVRYGYIRTSPVVELDMPVDKEPDAGRMAYSQDQLQRIVDGLAYHATKGGDVRHMRFWVPLIGLYSGARLNEICQMCIGDIVEIDGVYCFDINDRNKEQTHKSLKNKPSRRRIPIHPALIDLGLLRFVEKRKSEVPEDTHVIANLWPRASYQERKDWRRKVSYWFNEVFRSKFLTDEELADHKARRKSYCFHSLRHTFINQCQNQARMNARIEMRISGHADQFISEVHARYGKDMHPKILLDELVKLDYDLDISKLQGTY